MPKTTEFIMDKRGRPIRVVLNIRKYEKMLDELEELEAIRGYDAAKAENEAPIPYRTYRQKKLKERK